MRYTLRAKLPLFNQLRIYIKPFHKRIIFLLLALFFLCSTLPSQPIHWPLTRGPYPPGYDAQAYGQILFEADISSSDVALTWPERAEKVKAAFVHAYVGYKTYAFGMDELKSVSNDGVNK